jgi:hypothetical protein
MAADDRSPAQKGWATRRARQAHEHSLATCESLRGRFMEGGEALGDVGPQSSISLDEADAVHRSEIFPFMSVQGQNENPPPSSLCQLPPAPDMLLRTSPASRRCLLCGLL